jgi:hypothetical protein
MAERVSGEPAEDEDMTERRKRRHHSKPDPRLDPTRLAAASATRFPQQPRNRPPLSGRQLRDPVPEVLVEVDGGGVLAGFARIRHAACMSACRVVRNARSDRAQIRRSPCWPGNMPAFRCPLRSTRRSRYSLLQLSDLDP